LKDTFRRRKGGAKHGSGERNRKEARQHRKDYFLPEITGAIDILVAACFWGGRRTGEPSNKKNRRVRA